MSLRASPLGSGRSCARRVFVSWRTARIRAVCRTVSHRARRVIGGILRHGSWGWWLDVREHGLRAVAGVRQRERDFPGVIGRHAMVNEFGSELDDRITVGVSTVDANSPVSGRVLRVGIRVPREKINALRQLPESSGYLLAPEFSLREDIRDSRSESGIVRSPASRSTAAVEYTLVIRRWYRFEGMTFVVETSNSETLNSSSATPVPGDESRVVVDGASPGEGD